MPPDDFGSWTTRLCRQIGELLRHLVHGGSSTSPTRARFPARELVADTSWEDLPLSPEGQAQLARLRDRLDRPARRRKTRDPASRTRRGLLVLFTGTSSAGKPLAAAALGKEVGTKVLRVDTPSIGSQSIGEAEDYLDGIFEHARAEGAILFFDEADALFGRRSEVRDAHDRYANPETSSFLERFEVFGGVGIVVVETEEDLDRALLRRVDAAIDFGSSDGCVVDPG